MLVICCYSNSTLSVGVLACDLPLLSHTSDGKSKTEQTGVIWRFYRGAKKIQKCCKNYNKTGVEMVVECSVFVRSCSVFNWSLSCDKGWRGGGGDKITEIKQRWATIYKGNYVRFFDPPVKQRWRCSVFERCAGVGAVIYRGKGLTNRLKYVKCSAFVRVFFGLFYRIFQELNYFFLHSENIEKTSTT